jgi:hypothetical protein
VIGAELMSEDRRPASVWRSIAIILMSLTVLFTIMGGIGTTCVAFGAEKYESMKSLVPYKPIYQVLVLISITAGIWGILIIVHLVRGGIKLYRNALIMLCVGVVTSGIQTAISQTVRGSSAPVNVRFFITVFTLIVFLLFRLPPLWNRILFTQSMKKKVKKNTTATSLILCGFIVLTTNIWTKPTHLAGWIGIIRFPLLISGWFLIGTGISLGWLHRPKLMVGKYVSHIVTNQN